MEDNRCISHGFIKALKDKKILGAFVDKTREENNLELCFRGNDDAVNIYCNNLTVWKIYDKNKKGEYKVEVSLHKSIDETERNRIASKLQSLGFNSFDNNGNVRRYPYVKRENFGREFVHETYKILIPMIDEYFKNGKHIEKVRQQEIFRTLTQQENGLFAYDLEQQQKGENKKGQNQPDMMAIRYKDGSPCALALVEVKSTKSACKDVESGILPHIDGMDTYMKNSEKMQQRLKEASDLISAYHILNLHKAPSQTFSPEMIRDFEIILILTDKAVEYYRDNEPIITKHIKEIHHRCTVIEWKNDFFYLL